MSRPPFTALFSAGQLRWTVVGIVIYAAATTAYYCSAILLPKALVDQGAAVSSALVSPPCCSW